MKRLRKLCALLLTGLLFVSFTGCQNTRQEFDDFIQSEFVRAMESDYMTSYVYMENPQNYGVAANKADVNLGIRLNEESIERQGSADTQSFQTFQKFKREQLSEEQKDIYDLYDYQMSLVASLNDEKFSYYQCFFQSMTGLHYQLPTLLADWTLRDEQSVKDLILLVEDTKPYVESALEYTKIQQEKGLLMLDFESILDHCESILQSGENSSVLRSMYENIDKLSLTKDQKDSYKEQLKQAFTDSFLSAYETIRDTMKSLMSGRNNEEGLCRFPNGKEYYELLLQKNIGSDKTVEEIRSMMSEQFNQHLNRYAGLVMTNAEVARVFSGESEMPATSFRDYTEILDYVRQKMQQDFPAVRDLSYNIRDVNEEIASASGVAAYFNIPALDGQTAKELRVNPNLGDISSLGTYNTVAHEGFPGHMYQYAYMYENVSSNFVKALGSVPAYTEGYAVYASYEALNYLEGVSPAIVQVYKEQELLTYCLMILADIGIHYDGWTLTEFSEFFASHGIQFSEDAARMQYVQLQANPCAFAGYYVGYHEIKQIKENAQEALGGEFSELAFNEALLKSGTAPFSVVQRNVDAYVNSKK